MPNFLCDIASKDKDKSVLIDEVNDNRCRYHPRWTKGEEQALLKSFPCPLTFCYLYPALFSFHCRQGNLRGKDNRTEQRVYCAAQEEGLEFTLSYRRRPRSIAGLFKKYAARFINLFLPFEQHDLYVDYKVTRAHGNCPLGIKTGDTFTFNVEGNNEICPAAFHSVYPFGQSMENKCFAGCPDYRTHVRFSSSKEAPADTAFDQCDAYKVKVQLKEAHGNFDLPIKKEHWYSMDELIGTLHLRCFTSFYIAFPYLLVLSNKGQLGYLSNDRNKAGICCPNDASQVNYMVSKDKKGRYRYQCIQSHPNCPRKLKEGDFVDLENFEGRVPFYSGLHDLYVVIKKWGQNDGRSTPNNRRITTTFGDCRMEWDICNETQSDQ